MRHRGVYDLFQYNGLEKVVRVCVLSVPVFKRSNLTIQSKTNSHLWIMNQIPSKYKKRPNKMVWGGGGGGGLRTQSINSLVSSEVLKND